MKILEQLKDVLNLAGADAKCTTLSAGAVLYHQGTSASNAYLIVEGLIKLARLENNGSMFICGLRGAGRLVGSTDAQFDGHYLTTAEAVTTAAIVRVASEHLRAALLQLPQAAEFVRNLHAREVCEHVLLASGLACLPAEDRLLRCLSLFLPPITGIGPGTSDVRIGLAIKEWELAQLIAVTPSHLCRLLARLERGGVLCRRKGWLVVHRRDLLEQHRAQVGSGR